MWHCVLWPSPLWKPWVCHWRWGCTPAAERGPETPLPAPPQWNAALRDTKTRKVIMTHFFFFFRAGETSIVKDDSQSAVWTQRSLPANVWAWLRSCVHVCRSAKALMPRQLVGWSWDCRKSQQTWRTSISWRRLAAGSRTCNYDTHINAQLQQHFIGLNLPNIF